MTRSEVALSAPVFGLDARIHVHVQKLPTSPGVVLSEIIVRSPQFKEAEWSHSTSTQSRNKFVETALAYALSYVCAMSYEKIGSSSITIVADTDYYSHPDETGSTNARFINFHVPITEAHKTGLGSSAALVTAFTAAVLAHYLKKDQLDLDSDLGRRRLHNIAQAAHCAAQGKVGSGFDVAAAVYGSCIYRRFSPSILEGLGEVGSPQFSARLRAVVDDSDPSNKWDMQIDKSNARIPQGLRLLMCDVDCGSETVGLVKKVLGWRKEKPEEASLLWATLQKGNEDLAKELKRLAQTDVQDYRNLKDIVLTIRSLIREMSSKADVPIEPPVQTSLLDACSKVSGVVGGVVPGAGGFDAIALLVEDQALPALQDLLSTYSSTTSADGGPAIGKGVALPAEYDLRAQGDPSSTAPIEMTKIEDQSTGQVNQTSQGPSSSPQNQPEISSPSAATQAAAPPREPLAITSANKNTTSASAALPPLTREKTGPAIGPSSDKPAPMPQEPEITGQTLMITILLITGARHPFKIDERYLKKRNVAIDGDNPFNMSVYTLKELIWREWRDDWEIRPSSPSAIRLIFYGKMLEDKSRLHDCRFEPSLTNHVVHMTVKPQEIVDEEDAKIAKAGGRDHDGNEGTTGCRCIIL
ncbi:MAG: hypothetical protein Q9203_006232 [Teloschistes exilis]